MKLLKRIFTGLLVFLIVIFLAVIIYIMQWKEHPTAIKPQHKVAKKAQQPKPYLSKAPKERLEGKVPVRCGSLPHNEKEKIAAAKTEKVRLPQRRVAIIIDDIGNDLKAVKELLEIESDITFAIMPLCRHTREAAEAVHKAHREVLLHLPMEPLSYPRENPGNGALFTDMNDDELIFQLNKDLASVPHVSGVNNHMGSKFMSNEKKLELIFDKLREKRLFFIDSRTTPNSKALSASKRSGLPVASRRMFIDNKRDYKEIYKILEGVARNTRDGNVSPIIIIGHPYSETIKAIRDSAKLLRDNGVCVVPVSKLIQNKVAEPGAS
jgi:polysaccharide deacetylase 2 family uncharacterized protein YibQ